MLVKELQVEEIIKSKMIFVTTYPFRDQKSVFPIKEK